MAEWGRSSFYKTKYVCSIHISGKKKLLRVHACLLHALRFFHADIILHADRTITRVFYLSRLTE